MKTTFPTKIFLLMFLTAHSDGETLPAFSQKVIDVRLPASRLNTSKFPISLSARSLPSPLQAREVRRPQEEGSVIFSSVYDGHLNTWSLNLTQEEMGLGQQQGVNKTLCVKPGENSSQEIPDKFDFVTLVAFSNTDQVTELELAANWNSDFLVSEDQEVRADLVRGSSEVFQFLPGPEYNAKHDETYLLTVTTETNPDQCLYVAINPPGCPWHDQPNTVRNSRIWSRMLNIGYFPIRAKDFPDSFTVALVPVMDSRECRTKGSKEARKSVTGVKVVSLKIQRSLASYSLPISISMLAIVLLSLLFFLAWGCCWRTQLHNNKKRILERQKYDRTFRESCERHNSSPPICSSCSQEVERQPISRQVSEPLTDLMTARETTISPENVLRQKLCQELEDKNGDKLRHPEKRDKTGYAINRLMRDTLTLQDLSVALKDAWHRRQRSKAYLYLVPLVSLFYMVPGAQMVYAEQKRARETGDKEQCFLNYGCSRPLGIFDDFNHIISNSGYIIYGIVFIILVRLKSKFLPAENRTESDHLGRIGLPQQHSIFYCMGVCCVMQGVFSAIFHVCPSNISLQFDTTMMYIMLILVFIKIYQFRHPDVATNAYHCMYAFAAALIMEALSLYIFSATAKFIFYLLFTLMYAGTVLHIAVDCYYYGALKTNLLTNIPIFCRHSVQNCSSCLYPRRFYLSISFIVINIFLMVFTLIRSMEEGARSLSTPILMICAVNVSLFLFYYMIRKIMEIVDNRHEGEGNRLRWTMRLFSFGFLLVALVLAGVAMMYYTSRHQSRNSTPPESRDQNELCNVMDFFDNHDMWHFFSATALFLAFIFLLTIDDDILLEDRDKIIVF